MGGMTYIDHKKVKDGDLVQVFGIDVSGSQGNIDWEEVKRAGVRSAMIRAGFGSGSIDDQFRRNAEGCTRQSIPFGVYWLSYAWSPGMAREEAR